LPDIIELGITKLEIKKLAFHMIQLNENKGMKKAISILAVIIFCTGMFQCKESGTAVKVPKNVDFNFDIRPILVQNCYLCHGPDPSSRKADLRLDTFEGATAQREEGNPAIVPGNISKSEMIKRITHHDADAMMPPPESNLS